MVEEKEHQMERLFRDNYERMYRLAFALLHDKEEARDVVSDVFSRMLHKQLVPDTAYLLRSVKNACLNVISKKKRDERLAKLLPVSDVNEEPEKLEKQWQATVDCIDRDLTPQTASVIRMCYGDGLSYKEAAQELGISISAVNKHIVKGLRMLREKLKGM